MIPVYLEMSCAQNVKFLAPIEEHFVQQFTRFKTFLILAESRILRIYCAQCLKIMCDANSDLAITAMSFNADCSLMAITTTEYFATFNCIPVQRIVKDDSQGGIKCIAQLHRSPLIVFVPSGDKPGTSPRRLVLWNSSTKETIREYGFETTILGCAINKFFLAVGTEAYISLFELQTMKLVAKVESRSGSVFALSGEENALLAYPSPASIGRKSEKQAETIYDGMISMYSCSQGRLVSQIKAHKSAISVLSASVQGDLLASASVTGSLVRVFRVPEGECIHVLRHSVPTPMSLFSFPLPSADDQSAADKRVSWIRFCPKGHFLLSATAPSGARGGYVNVFRVGGVGATTDGLHHTESGSGRSSLLGERDDEGDADRDYFTVQTEDVPSPAALLAVNKDSSDAGTIAKAVEGSWSDWQKQLQQQAAVHLRSLQALSQECLESGTAAARAAASAMGASAMAATGTRPLLYARIHSAEEKHIGTAGAAGATSASARDQFAGSGSGLLVCDIEGAGAVEGRGCGTGARAYAAGMYGVAHGRDGPSFFAALNYVPTATGGEGDGSQQVKGDKLALNVISAVGGIYRRYNISFLQRLSIEESSSSSMSGTVSLSDTRPPSATSALPQTLSELLEDECALLE